MGGNFPQQCVRFDCLQHTGFLSSIKASRIRRNQHIRWGVAPFGLQSGQQGITFSGDKIHGDAGLGAEPVQQRLN